ncbi:cyclic nucleotide-binding-like protein [Chytriomyces cf. hyalinus JEL632]|nr:cyclic nucleotide-binding-like protein [Chytriomyces cf. hyalinus JEL632]
MARRAEPIDVTDILAALADFKHKFDQLESHLSILRPAAHSLFSLLKPSQTRLDGAPSNTWETWFHAPEMFVNNLPVGSGSIREHFGSKSSLVVQDSQLESVGPSTTAPLSPMANNERTKSFTLERGVQKPNRPMSLHAGVGGSRMGDTIQFQKIPARSPSPRVNVRSISSANSSIRSSLNQDACAANLDEKRETHDADTDSISSECETPPENIAAYSATSGRNSVLGSVPDIQEVYELAQAQAEAHAAADTHSASLQPSNLAAGGLLPVRKSLSRHTSAKAPKAYYQQELSVTSPNDTPGSQNLRKSITLAGSKARLFLASKGNHSNSTLKRPSVVQRLQAKADVDYIDLTASRDLVFENEEETRKPLWQKMMDRKPAQEPIHLVPKKARSLSTHSFDLEQGAIPTITIMAQDSLGSVARSARSKKGVSEGNLVQQLNLPVVDTASKLSVEPPKRFSLHGSRRSMGLVRTISTMTQKVIQQATAITSYQPNRSAESLGDRFKNATPQNEPLSNSVQKLETEKKKWSFFQDGFNEMSAFFCRMELIHFAVNMAVLWMAPLKMGFLLDLSDAFSIIVTVVFAVDCFLSCFTIRRSHHAMQSIKNATLRHWQSYYFTHGFAIDLITSFPFELLPYEYSHFLWCIRMLRVYKLSEMAFVSPTSFAFQKTMEGMGLGSSLTVIVPLTFISLIFFHLQACVLYLFGRIYEGSNDEIGKIMNATIWEQYTWAMFQAVANTFPLAYRPVTSIERWLFLSFSVIGAVLYASVVGVISSVAMSIDASARLYKQKVDELKEYMRWKDLDPTTRRKVMKYYELKYRGKFFEETTLLNEMNESLKMEIAVHNCKELISKVSFLNRHQKDGRDDLFIGRIATSLVPCYFVPGDIIIFQGEIGNDMYFMLSGSVSVIVGENRVSSLNEGSFFGEVALIANIPRTATIQAERYCMLYKLTRDAFTSILRDFEDVRRNVDIIYKERMERIRLEEEARKIAAARELMAKVPFLRREIDDGRNDLFVYRVATSLVAAFYVSGDTVFNQGDIGNDMYFVKTGTVDVVVGGKKVSYLKEGSFFGEVAVIANIPRTATIAAATPCMLYRLTRPAFESIMDEFKDVGENVQVIFAERMERVKIEEDARKLSAAQELVSKVTFLQRGEGDGKDELFLLRIAKSLVASFFTPGDCVFSQGDLGHEMYFIKNGSVDIIVGNNVVTTLKDGAFFGEVALLANIPRTATVKASTACMLYRLTRESFESIVSEFDDVKKRIDIIYRERMEKVKLGM